MDAARRSRVNKNCPCSRGEHQLASALCSIFATTARRAWIPHPTPNISFTTINLYNYNKKTYSVKRYRQRISRVYDLAAMWLQALHNHESKESNLTRIQGIVSHVRVGQRPHRPRRRI